ncbi:toxin [Salmonella enterica subsp. enterica serovar Telhashomer]|nr:toxin [Salmonella enterica subsp. enterica serovar Telhashomer]EBQ1658565.1 toxin [Salmonella enterica]EEC1060782.1 toxin [Salmonella enterica subsp. enterica]EBQ1830235.1 toxin [Salmonella enterica]EBQ4336493.1 toxin [Salmonella enterica]
MQIKKYKWVLFLFAFILTGCSSDKVKDDPRIYPNVSGGPGKGDIGVPVPGAGPALPSNAPVRIPGPKDRPIVSLVNMDGSVLTTWARGAGAVLWAYQIGDSNTFGAQRNWRILQGTRPGTIQFQNVDNDQCVTSLLTTGVFARKVMITADCSSEPERFDMKLLQTQNGNYLIKSLATDMCARAEFLGRTRSSPYATTVTVDSCPRPGEHTFEFMWSISEPIAPALAIVSSAATS